MTTSTVPKMRRVCNRFLSEQLHLVAVAAFWIAFIAGAVNRKMEQLHPAPIPAGRTVSDVTSPRSSLPMSGHNLLGRYKAPSLFTSNFGKWAAHLLLRNGDSGH